MSKYTFGVRGRHRPAPLETRYTDLKYWTVLGVDTPHPRQPHTLCKWSLSNAEHCCMQRRTHESRDNVVSSAVVLRRDSVGTDCVVQQWGLVCETFQTDAEHYSISQTKYSRQC